MNMNRLACIAFGIGQFIASPATAEEELGGPGTHCETHELVVLSCPIAGKSDKHMSICRTSAQTSANAYMQYRFGKLGQTPELTYPATTQMHAREAFQFSVRSPNGWTGADNLHFKIGQASYTVYQFSSARFPEKEAGVVVRVGEKKPIYIECTESSTSHYRDLNELRKLELPEMTTPVVFGPKANKIYRN